jgi:hypothetical protein
MQHMLSRVDIALAFSTSVWLQTGTVRNGGSLVFVFILVFALLPLHRL